jgi:hypothetical protein
MAEPMLSLNLEGFEEAEARLFALEQRVRRYPRQIADELADESVALIRQNAPRREGYIFRHTDRSPVLFEPGGAGGGGAYAATAGVKSGDSRHPLYVHQGTGFYGAVGWWIVPRIAKKMRIPAGRGFPTIFTSKTRGQRANPFVQRAYTQVKFSAQSRLLYFGADVLYG